MKDPHEPVWMTHRSPEPGHVAEATYLYMDTHTPIGSGYNKIILLKTLLSVLHSGTCKY